MATAAHKRSRRRFAELACICFAIALVGWLVFPIIHGIGRSEWILRDSIVSRDLNALHAEHVVFLAIDERSITLDHLFPEDIEQAPVLGTMVSNFPWPRPVYAEALDRLVAAGARLIIFDLIFDKPREGDEAFKAALDRHASKVVLGANYSVDPGDPANPSDDLPSITMPSATLVPEAGKDPRVGYVNFWPEYDDTVREAIYSTTLRERIGAAAYRDEPVYSSLAAVALRQLGIPAPATKKHEPLPFRFTDSSKISTYPFHALFVPYEWKQILKNGEVFRDKIVMVGPSATRLQDFHKSIFPEKIAGPLLHLNAILAAWNDSFYNRAGPAVRILLILCAALAAFGISWHLQRRPVAAFSALFGVSVLYLATTYAILVWADYLLFPLQPTLVLLLAGTSCTAWNFAQARRESGRMRSTLERYVSRNVVREILDNRDDFLSALGGTRRPMTVFFSDVRGFTSFSERSDAAAIVEQLNEYLGEMVGVIFRHQGTVDKFMGDGIMAVWGNVVSEGPAKDAINAVSASLEMLQRLETLNAERAKRGLAPFRIGIGLHHGEAVFGNIGSAEKMEPTVIGDTVNLASRVEGLTKKYGVTLCITQPLAELISGHFHLRFVDLVQVVGKSQPIGILTVIGPRSAEKPEWLDVYERAIADLRSRRFAEAAAALRRCLEADPGDALSAIHLARAEAFIAHPPPEDWNGAEIATSK